MCIIQAARGDKLPPPIIRNLCQRDFLFHPVYSADTPKPELKRVHRFWHGADRIPGTFAEGASLYFIKEWAPSGAHGLIDECNQCLAIAPEFVPKPRCENEAVGPATDDDDVVRFIWTIHR